MSLIKKILGLVLLFIGLTIIFYSLYSSYNIFTNKTAAPEVFKIETKEGSTVKTGTQDIQAQLQTMIQEQLRGMLPPDTLQNIFNLISWSIFAGILILGGAQISGLGIKLLK